ncbi:hypothetical protein [Brumimicrobium aurantiacum]|uniref:Uncharacterized protein n=1 Tax=Brumimicrobium aurantiacum TaxID=1737063 RepID=A0A3E1EYQ3_9FLAO|nr:hypothetical protein [Brumimicrobium aurantiacum]RFC54613.1 hypothetical protein DXU93_06390 [Brumimicrobium aurantiacum]
MKTKYYLFLVAFLGTLLFESCAIEKRKHLKGWHIALKSTKNNQSQISKHSIVSVKPMPKLNKDTSDLRIEKLPDVYQASNEVLLTSEIIDIPIEQKSTQENEVNNLNRLKIEHKNSNVKTEITKVNNDIQSNNSKEKQEDKSEKKGRFFGSFLGALAGLIALPFLFVFSWVFLSGDYEDDIEWIASSKDSVFKSAFKRSFNGVVKVGFTVLTIALMLFVASLIIAFLYVEAGIIGVILGIAAIVLLLVLLAYLFDKFLSFILPGY